MFRRSIILALVASSVAVACGGDSTDDIPIVADRPAVPAVIDAAPEAPPLERLDAVPIASGLSEPVAVAPAPGVSETFLVERTGRIVTLSSEGRQSVLDLTSRVGWDVNEQGLLGFAVHPEFPSDPRGFAVYTDIDRDLVVEAFDWNGSVFDVSSRSPVLLVPQPHKYHQGGGIVFDRAGHLYITLGDGGGGGDKRENGQNPNTLLGTIIRIDIDAADPYGIPESNPFVDGGGAAEVWAYGLRNPWRIAFDGGRLVVVDVGENGGDEINVVSASAAGLNYGWPIMEGHACFREAECDASGFVVPAHVVDRTRTCAVIGGPVYRGREIPEVYGHLLFGDFCIGWVRSAEVHDDGLGPIVDWESQLGTLGMITSIGTDHTGEPLVTTIEGDVLRIVPVRTS